jgi:hypothetical protein
MIGCLISLLIAAIVCLIVILIVEMVLAQFVPLSGKVIALIRLLIGLLLLLYFLDCVVGYGGVGIFPGHWRG